MMYHKFLAWALGPETAFINHDMDKTASQRLPRLHMILLQALRTDNNGLVAFYYCLEANNTDNYSYKNKQTNK